MKGLNQRGNGKDVTFLFLHFEQWMYGTLNLHFEINSIGPEDLSLTGSNEELMNLL